MLTTIDQGDLRGHGRRKDSFQGGALGGTKVAKFVFSHAKLKKQPFLLKFSKSTDVWSPLAPLPTPMYVDATFVNIRNPLTALLGWDKLSSDC